MSRCPDSKAESATVGLESIDTFCYLGDMLSAGGGVEAVHCWVEMCFGASSMSLCRFPNE